MTASLTQTQQKLGNLECIILDTPGCDEKVDALVIICHGFGAAGDDLVPVAGEIFRVAESNLPNVRFVFPAAPIQLDASGYYDSRAWWPIDMIKLQQMMERGEYRDLRKDQPELLAERNAELVATMQQAMQSAAVDHSKVILGGFSQGSMLATEVAISLPEMIGGLVVWSGTLLCEDQWRQNAANKKGLKVKQTHGKIDPILPLQGAELLRDMLLEFEANIQFAEFEGPHTIPETGITMALDLIQEVVAS